MLEFGKACNAVWEVYDVRPKWTLAVFWTKPTGKPCPVSDGASQDNSVSETTSQGGIWANSRESPVFAQGMCPWFVPVTASAGFFAKT